MEYLLSFAGATSISIDDTNKRDGRIQKTDLANGRLDRDIEGNLKPRVYSDVGHRAVQEKNKKLKSIGEIIPHKQPLLSEKSRTGDLNSEYIYIHTSGAPVGALTCTSEKIWSLVSENLQLCILQIVA